MCDEIRACLVEWETMVERSQTARAACAAGAKDAGGTIPPHLARAYDRALAAESVAREHARKACCVMFVLVPRS